MKDMSVAELEEGIKAVIKSDDVGVLSKLGITNCWNELLRRFESLEKELKAVKIAHAVAEDIMHTNFALCKSSAEHWKMMVKDLKCCGNCTYESSGQCFVDSDDDIINKTCGNLRCESWESDLMTKSERWISREEREGK